MLPPLPWIPPLRLGTAPPLDALAAFAAAAEREAELCDYSGSTSDETMLPSQGWFINRSEHEVGRGREAYTKAVRALERLECMQLSWLRVRLHGKCLAICSRQFGGLWLLNANFVLRQQTDGTRSSSSIAWGTSTRHVLAGEERLSVRWDASTDLVHFEILSFSRPRHFLSWATYPYVLLQQKRFAHDASLAMRDLASRPSVRGGGGPL